MNEINPVALFRLSVLGPLISPEQLQRGELQTINGGQKARSAGRQVGRLRYQSPHLADLNEQVG